MLLREGGCGERGGEMLWKRGGRWRENTNNREQRDRVHLIVGDGKGGNKGCEEV